MQGGERKSCHIDNGDLNLKKKDRMNPTQEFDKENHET